MAKPCQTVKKTSESSQWSNPLKFSTVPSSVYDAGWTPFFGEKSPFQSKAGESGIRRGACIPVHQLVKTFLTSHATRCRCGPALPPRFREEPNRSGCPCKASAALPAAKTENAALFSLIHRSFGTRPRRSTRVIEPRARRFHPEFHRTASQTRRCSRTRARIRRDAHPALSALRRAGRGRSD